MSTDTNVRVLMPLTDLIGALKAGTTVPEPDTANGEVAWVSGGTYAVDDLRTSAGSIWSAIQAHNGRTAAPASDSLYWLRKGPTSRTAPFDDYTATKATRTTSLTYVLQPGFFDGVKLYGLVGASASIVMRSAPGGAIVRSWSGDLYAQAAGLYELLFAPLVPQTEAGLDNIPISPTAELTITVTSPPGRPVAIGTIKVGTWRSMVGESDFGGAEVGAESERKTYTYRKQNDDGTYRITPRGNARNVRCTVFLDADEAMAADALLGEIIDIAVPFEATGLPQLGYLNTLGFVSGSVRADDWGVTTLNLRIEGNI